MQFLITMPLRLLAIIWALPYTLLGLLFGFIGLCTGGRARIRGRVIEFYAWRREVAVASTAQRTVHDCIDLGPYDTRPNGRRPGTYLATTKWSMFVSTSDGDR